MATTEIMLPYIRTAVLRDGRRRRSRVELATALPTFGADDLATALTAGGCAILERDGIAYAWPRDGWAEGVAELRHRREVRVGRLLRERPVAMDGDAHPLREDTDPPEVVRDRIAAGHAISAGRLLHRERVAAEVGYAFNPRGTCGVSREIGLRLDPGAGTAAYASHPRPWTLFLVADEGAGAFAEALWAAFEARLPVRPGNGGADRRPVRGWEVVDRRAAGRLGLGVPEGDLRGRYGPAFLDAIRPLPVLSERAIRLRDEVSASAGLDRLGALRELAAVVADEAIAAGNTWQPAMDAIALALRLDRLGQRP